jgi:hypothetical protein
VSVYQLEPLQDPRWAELVERHPKASVFHTVGWLQALQRTYGFSPVVFTTSDANGGLTNGLVFCDVRSWLTGNRIISLPFSDHCEPLFSSWRDLKLIVEHLKNGLQHGHWKYLEIRPRDGLLSPDANEVGLQKATKYYLHRLHLRPALGDIFRSFHKGSVQRRIWRAEGAGVVCECGISAKLLKDFYNLLVLTRRRHQVPPQPYIWFRNLVDAMSEAVEIRVAYDGEIPIAAVLTLRFRKTVYYKYGGSDSKSNHLGAMPFLLWKAIEDSKNAGADEFDLGRSDMENEGLVSFKNHWGELPTDLVYWRFPACNELRSKKSRRFEMAKHLFAHMPDRLLTATGRLIYRHIA